MKSVCWKMSHFHTTNHLLSEETFFFLYPIIIPGLIYFVVLLSDRRERERERDRDRHRERDRDRQTERKMIKRERER